MSDGLKLIAIPNHKNGFKALITAQYAGVSVETPAYEHGVDNKKPEFLKLNPHGKVEPPPRCHDVGASIAVVRCCSRSTAETKCLSCFRKTSGRCDDHMLTCMSPALLSPGRRLAFRPLPTLARASALPVRTAGHQARLAIASPPA